jgi:hypothetical protein
MQTPSLRRFLSETGKIVHHLNTIAVGLATVESGAATKPSGLDVRWSPANIGASSRQARAFAVRASIVFVAEVLGAYVGELIGSPAGKGSSVAKERDSKLKDLNDWFTLPRDHVFLGATLLVHWRNRIVHRRSNAALTAAQRSELIAASADLASQYKNLDPIKLLRDFQENTPTLKDVSSLIAMTITLARRIEKRIPEPANDGEVQAWLAHFKLTEDLDRVRRVATGKGKLREGVSAFLRTYFPDIEPAYMAHSLRQETLPANQ